MRRLVLLLVLVQSFAGAADPLLDQMSAITARLRARPINSFATVQGGAPKLSLLDFATTAWPDCNEPDPAADATRTLFPH